MQQPDVTMQQPDMTTEVEPVVVQSQPPAQMARGDRDASYDSAKAGKVTRQASDMFAAELDRQLNRPEAWRENAVAQIETWKQEGAAAQAEKQKPKKKKKKVHDIVVSPINSNSVSPDTMSPAWSAPAGSSAMAQMTADQYAMPSHQASLGHSYHPMSFNITPEPSR